MGRPWFPKPYADRVARLRVPFGFLLAFTFGWLSHPSAGSLLAGFPVSIAGLALRAWAAGHLAKDSVLARSGPYRHTRNPLYIGTLLVACGLVIASRNLLLAAIFGAIFLLVYLPAIELEEQHLRELFPDYQNFAASVPALWPRFLPSANNERPFQPSLYLKNREYQASLGFLAGAAYLIGRLWLR